MTSDRALLLAAAALMDAAHECTTAQDVIDAAMAITPRDLGLQWCELNGTRADQGDRTMVMPLPGRDGDVLVLTFEGRAPARVAVDAYVSCVAALVAERVIGSATRSEGSAAGAEEVKVLQAEVERLQGLLQFIAGLAEHYVPETH